MVNFCIFFTGKKCSKFWVGNSWESVGIDGVFGKDGEVFEVIYH